MNHKIAGFFKLFLISLFFIWNPVKYCFSQQTVTLEETMVKDFYNLNHQQLFWYSSVENLKRATEWLKIMNTADQLGIIMSQSQTDQIRMALIDNLTLDINYKELRDRQITGLVLNFLKGLQEGNIKFDYDEVRVSRDSVYVDQLLKSSSTELVQQTVLRLECRDHDFMVLQKFLTDSVAKMNPLKFKKIVLAMNYARYFFIYHKPEQIVVNIPEAEIRYYQNNFLKLKMRAVVGKKLKPTPTIASYVTDVVSFPKWNVPRSIAVTEILPKVQLKENYLEQNNYEVVDAKGHVVDESILKWNTYDEKNFPYYFRQGAGSRNAMGTIKFELQNPFSIFLHATSMQTSFAKDYRFLSHGCVRVEKPFILADRLLKGEIDIKKLKSGKKNTETKTIRLPYKVPVFIVYNPVIVIGQKVIFLPDTYGLLN
jgi:hypothetical protein